MNLSKRTIASAIIVVFLSSQSAIAAPARAGAQCPKLGQRTVIAKQTYSCAVSGKKLNWRKISRSTQVVVKQTPSTPTPTPSAIPDAAIDASDYATVASKARTSILTSIPKATSIPTMDFIAEPSVPQINITRMKEEATAALNVYATMIPDVKVIHFLLYENDAWALDQALRLNPATDYPDYDFNFDMNRSFTGRPELHLPCRSFGGFSVDALKEPLVVIQNAECDWANPQETAKGIDYSSSVIGHEITHLVQQRISGTQNSACVLAAWLREGEAQVAGMDLSVADGVDASVNTRNAVFARMIRPTGIDAFTSLESSSPGGEYNVGAALSEYLIGRSGWTKLTSLEAIVGDHSSVCSHDQLPTRFTNGFQKIYGQSLTSFYQEALPYVQYVYDNQLHL